ncbi:riboflavin biosynthesis protein RibF [Ruminococcus sp.]|uniref:riboflavin biosynthesis protein RibF n=1 Tax=Ruminococcus sp. TaxID=41978 RepID=UPI00388D9958
MKVYHSLHKYQPHAGGACVALGFFDGVHRGHRAVIGACAGDSGALPCLVLTFAESPLKALGKPSPPLLSRNPLKARLLEEAGADEVIFADFNAIKALSPTEFVRSVLHDRLNAKSVYCGFNYRFGKDGAGDTDALRRLCEPYGIQVRVSEPVCCGGEQASSSLIRERIMSGEIAHANELLGYRYAVRGEITGGNQVGSVIGFPTVNLPMDTGLVTPCRGVYASRIRIDGISYRGATNIGVHPTVGAKEEPLCETFLLDFEGGDLYGKQAVCELIAFVRPERRFGSVEELTAQIQRDCETIRGISD